jgi:8-oxo-dGTP diphosphatase
MATGRAASPAVRAGGGVVWRNRRGKTELAVIHRPRYDDWSLPKGKLDDGETQLAAAAREVREEIGAQVAVSRRIGEVSYDTPTGRKSVAYWAMRYLDGLFTPGDEVDALDWLRPAAARELLSYDVDKRIVADFEAVPLPDSVIVLVRHAKAGRRATWRGDDLDRPLDATGRAQVGRLTELLVLFAPDRIFSAEPVRCIDTVKPLAERLDLSVRVDPVFGDNAFLEAPSATEDALLALAKPGKVSVVCSQGDAIPGLVERVGRGVLDPDTRKGAFWVLSVVDGTIVSTDYYEDALARS